MALNPRCGLLNFPKMSLPAWPSTVDSGKLGISVYGNSYVSVISEANCPRPVPSIIVVSGLVVILGFSEDGVS